MAAKPSDSYNPVASVEPTTAAPQDYNTTRANPNEFGAQVGQAIQGLGNTINQAATEQFDVNMKRQGMLNETWATNAETQLNTHLGDIEGDYKSKRGLEAVAATPIATKAVNDTYNQILSSAPNPAAARAFQMIGARAIGYTLRDFGNYHATQIKAADTDSAVAARDNTVSLASNPNLSDQQFQDLLDNGKFQTNRIVSNYGYGLSSGTGATQNADGSMSFDETTPQGKDAKSVYNDQMSKYYSSIAESRAKALSDPTTGNAVKTYAWLDANKDWIPPEARSRIVASLAPQLHAEYTRQDAGQSLGEADQRYIKSLGQPSASTAGYNEQGMTTFVTGLIPGAKVTSTVRTEADNTRVGGVQNSGHLNGTALDFVPPDGMSLQDAANKIKQENPNLKVIVEDTGAAHSTGPHIHIQWSGLQPAPTNGQPPTAITAAQPDINYKTKADYYQQNLPQIVERAGQIAASRPGADATSIELAKEKAKSDAMFTIATQNQSSLADYHTVEQAIATAGANGHPMTSEDDINSNPQLRATYWNLVGNDPYKANGILRMLDANKRGQQKTYGTETYQHLMGVLASPNDPNYISDVTHLANSIGADPNSPLTNSGYSALSKVVQARDASPQGRAFADSERQFFQDTYKLGNPTAATGGFSQTFDKKYQDQIPTVLNQIEQARQQGKSPTQLFSPLINGKPNPDYMGNHFVYPTRDDIEKERGRNLQTVRTVANNNFQDLAQHPEKIQTQEQLQSLIKAGLIKKDPKVLADIIRNNPNLSKKYIKQSDTQAPQVPFAQGLQ